MSCPECKRIASFMANDPELYRGEPRLCAKHRIERDDHIALLQDAHRAIDHLYAERIALDKSFRPTQHPTWPVLVRIAAVLEFTPPAPDDEPA